MSIWSSHDGIGHDDWLDGLGPRGGDVRSYAQGWSNHYPADDVEQPAHLTLASMPVFCVPGRQDEEETLSEDARGPWLRLGVHSRRHDHRGRPTSEPADAYVVMDEGAARTLAADLLEWANATKVQPRA